MLKITSQKIKGIKKNGSMIYPMAGGMQMTFLDDWTMLFGDVSAVKAALDARDNSGMSLNANRDITDLIPAVEAGQVSRALGSAGPHTMFESALGSAGDLQQFVTI